MVLKMSDGCAAPHTRPRSMAALEDVLDVQRRLIEVGAEMSWLVNRFQAAGVSERPALRERLDDLTATLLSFSEQMRTSLMRYRRGDYGV